MRKLALILPLSILASAAHAGDLGAIRLNNEGAARLKAGRTNEAYERFTAALRDLPFSGAVHYNIACTFLANQEFDKAVNEYREAVRLAASETKADKSARFYALFNSAVALTELKKPAEALDAYQKALELQPDSIETKTNIELLSKAQQGGGDSGDQNQDQNKDQKDKQGQQQKKDGQGDDKDKKDQPQPQPQQFDNKKQPNKPKPFKSDELTQADVNRILDELKDQEERVRAEMNREGGKEVPPDKDW